MTKSESFLELKANVVSLAAQDAVIEAIAQKVVAETFDTPELNAQTEFEQLASGRLAELGLGQDSATSVFMGSLANTAKLERDRVQAVRNGHDKA